MVMVFFAHSAFVWKNALTVIATVKTATTRVVAAGYLIDVSLPHINVP